MTLMMCSRCCAACRHINTADCRLPLPPARPFSFDLTSSGFLPFFTLLEENEKESQDWTPAADCEINMADTHRASAQGRKKWVFPQRSLTDGNKASVRSADRDTDRTLAVPFRGPITGGLQPGKKVVVVGVVDPRPDRFYVALTCGRGTGGEPPPDVALELCVRFRDRQVLRRACVSGSWGDVDRAAPFFPFIREQPFKMEIHCEHSRFRVLVDGQQLFDFNHRVSSLRDVDTLWIKGSVTVTKLA